MKAILLILLFSLPLFSNQIIIRDGIRLPKDSSLTSKMLSDLSVFLNDAHKDSVKKNQIIGGNYLYTKLLTDELIGIQSSKNFNNESFYKPYLDNLIILNDNEYLLKVSFIGFENETSYFRASFDIKSVLEKDQFKFESFFKARTENWKMKLINNHTFYFKDSINSLQLNKYVNSVSMIDTKLGLTDFQTDVYCCEDIFEAQQLIGINYKSDFNGAKFTIFSSKDNQHKVKLLANDNSYLTNIDPHDLWHDRLSLIKPRREFYRPIDEGCAYFYGGSWGFSWEEILETFRDSVATKKSVNWYSFYEKPSYFKTGKYSNNTFYVINALFVKEIEERHGFEGVWKFLQCDNKGEKYFTLLDDLIGINEENFNFKINHLLDK